MEYFISDTHFGHRGSLKWSESVRKDLFNSIKEADEYMIKQWNSVVSETDTIYFLGDFAYKCNKEYAESIFWRLNGIKHLIIGNHDSRLAEKFINCWESKQQRLTLKLNGYIIILDHYPLESWDKKHHGSIHLHGHTHERTPNISGKIFNVSVENIEYTPITLEQILQRIELNNLK